MPLILALALAGVVGGVLMSAAGSAEQNALTGRVAVAADPLLGPVDVEGLGVAEDEDLTIDIWGPAPRMLVATKRGSGTVSAVAMALPGQADLQLNRLSTAATVAYWSPSVQSAATEDERLARLSLVVAHPSFEQLVQDSDSTEMSAETLAEALAVVDGDSAGSCGWVCGEEIRDDRAVLSNNWSGEIEVRGADGTRCVVLPPARLSVDPQAVAIASAALAGQVSAPLDTSPTWKKSTTVVDLTRCGRALRTYSDDGQGRVTSRAERLLFMTTPGESRRLIEQFSALDELRRVLRRNGLMSDTSERVTDLLLSTTSSMPEIEIPILPLPTVPPPLPIETPTGPVGVEGAVSFEQSPGTGHWVLTVEMRNVNDTDLQLADQPWVLFVDGSRVEPDLGSRSAGAGVLLGPGELMSATVRFTAGPGRAELEIRFADGRTVRVMP